MPFLKLGARVVGLGICDDREAGFTTRLVEHMQLDYDGIVGDARRKRTRPTDAREQELGYRRGTDTFNYRQVTLVQQANLEAIAAALGVAEVTGSMLGANVVLEGPDGFNFSLMRAGIIRFTGGAGLMVTMQNGPCKAPGEVIRQHYGKPQGFELDFVPAAINRRGMLAVVFQPGCIVVGDTADIYEREIEDINLD